MAVTAAPSPTLPAPPAPPAPEPASDVVTPPDRSVDNTLPWLRRLRWTAVAGQLATIFFAIWVLKMPLPLQPLLIILLITAMSNGALYDFPGRSGISGRGLFTGIMALDVLLLSAMLYWTGGVHNPFTSFYLVHIALAAMVLDRKSLWALVALCMACFGWIYFHYYPLDHDHSAHGVHNAHSTHLAEGVHGPQNLHSPQNLHHAHAHHGEGLSFELHLQGMAVAFLLTSACIAYFVGKMHDSLRSREQELAEARLRATRHDQLSALASLSAGVAHELGSPLGTIAVVSHELERDLEKKANAMGDAIDTIDDTLEDARLIRREVDRCRAILDRLSAQSTQGVGDACRGFSPDLLLREVHTSLGPTCIERLRAVPADMPGEFFLPLAPLAQALGVLIQNACDADPTGAPVELIARQTTGHLQFEVRDRGTGLSPAVAKKAGEPFFSTKAPGHGMGLGLFLVRTLASRLGGELHLTPRPGGGTLARLTLPLNPHPSES